MRVNQSITQSVREEDYCAKNKICKSMPYRHATVLHSINHNSSYLLSGDVNKWLKGTELYDNTKTKDLPSDPSSSSRIIFAVFRNLYWIINWWITQREAHAISMNPDGRIWKMVLCLPGDHFKNHKMQVQRKSTVMPLLRVIKKINNLYFCIL